MRLANYAERAVMITGDDGTHAAESGVGVAREPQRFIQAGQRSDSWIERIGALHQIFQAQPTMTWRKQQCRYTD